MENELTTTSESPAAPAGCANCNHPVIEQGYPTPLCADCRHQLIRFPIPLWIKVFGAGVILLVLFSFFGVRKQLRAAVHYERGKNAVQQKQFATAKKEMDLAAGYLPEFSDLNAYRAIVAFNTQDISGFAEILQSLQGKEVKDDDLYNQVNVLIVKAEDYLPSDSFIATLDRNGGIDSIPEERLHEYTVAHPDDMLPAARYASVLFDREEYAACDSLLTELLAKDPFYVNALKLKSVNKRMIKEIDSAMYYTDRILDLNRESSYGMSSKARILLVQNKDADGLKWAKEAVAVDDHDGYAQASLVLAYHFNNQTKERDQLIEQLKKDSLAGSFLQYPLDVIAGKEKFRN